MSVRTTEHKRWVKQKTQNQPGERISTIIGLLLSSCGLSWVHVIELEKQDPGKPFFSLVDYWKSLLCLRFSGEKVKGGERNVWEEAYNGNTYSVRSGRASWSCQVLFVLCSKNPDLFVTEFGKKMAWVKIDFKISKLLRSNK